jgi:hypothetical protein
MHPLIAELSERTTLDVSVVPIEHDSIVLACRAGPSVETDFRGASREQFHTVFAARCGITEQRRISALVYRRRLAVEKFLQNNPKLRTTLITRWPGIQVLWLEAKGQVPSNIGFGDFAWYSEGLIPVGVPERPPDHFIVQSGRVAVIDFEDLHWERLEKEGFEVALLEDQVGRRYRQTSKGRFLNVRFWSRYLAQKFNMSYEPGTSKFALRRIDPPSVVFLSESQMIEALFDCLETISRAEPEFPASEIGLGRIKELVKLMKNRVERESMGEGEIIHEFVETEVIRCPGGMLTSKELWSRFQAFCRAKGLPLCPERTVCRRVRQEIRSHFGIGQSHDRRDGRGNPRFYRHLSLRPEHVVVAQLADAAIEGCTARANKS